MRTNAPFTNVQALNLNTNIKCERMHFAPIYSTAQHSGISDKQGLFSKKSLLAWRHCVTWWYNTSEDEEQTLLCAVTGKNQHSRAAALKHNATVHTGETFKLSIDSV